MARTYSDDLRERVVRAVIKSGLSRHQAAAQFGVGIGTAINWVRGFHEMEVERHRRISAERSFGSGPVLACQPLDAQ